MMDALPPNLKGAKENAGYYDHLWPQAGLKRHYSEVNRVRFAVDVITAIKQGKPLRILDLGCGMGWMAPFLSPLGSVTGIDFSVNGIEIARAEYDAFAEFHLADPEAPNLGLPTDSLFDVVICSEVIEHVLAPLDLLVQISNLLAPLGWCVLTTPNGNVWREFDEDPRYKADQQPIENWLTTAQLPFLLQKAGFRVERHEGRPLYEFRHGLTGLLQRSSLETLFRRVGLGDRYYRLILPTALYQVIAAQKVV